MDDILTEVFIVVGQSGRVYEKDEILDLIPSIPKGSFDVDDFQVCELGEEYALNGYRMVRADDSGKDPDVSNRYSIWRRESNRWRMIFHQGTPICSGDQAE